MVTITVVPNNELRVLNIFYKFADAFDSTHAPDSIELGSHLRKNSHVTQTRLEPLTFNQFVFS